MSLYDALLQTVTVALKAVKGQSTVRKSLAQMHYQQDCHQHCHLVAIGKAAESMSLGAIEELGDTIKSGLIISKHGHFNSTLKTNSRFQCIEADHPVPKLASLKAGGKLLQYMQQLPENAYCLVLISGGTSSLAEVLHNDWTLKELQEVTQYLLSHTYPIDEINAVRQRISKIKAGGLWDYIRYQKITCLIISDVASDDPAIIGSGLLFPSDSPLPENFPLKWKKRLKPSSPIESGNLDWKIIATLDDAKQAAATAARKLGYRVKVDPNFLQGNAENVAKQCVHQLQQSDVDMIIWGGETTVKLPDNAPIGGRNQHFALATAIELNNSDDNGFNTAFACIGTDGSDGSSHVAGGLVDLQTVQRGEMHSLSATASLQQANAHAFLKASGDLIITGATETNVMDLVIGIKALKFDNLTPKNPHKI
jgi:hydroxypyruvate reductase